MDRAFAESDPQNSLWKGEWLADFEPFNIEVEQQLLGLALAEHSSIAFMRAELSPADFYDPLHQRIFERIFAKHEANRPVTPVTLHASLKNDPGLLKLECGGLEYFSRCTYFSTGVTPAWGSQGSLQAIVTDLARQIVELKARRDATEALRDSFELLRRGETGGTVLDALVPVVSVADTEADREEQKQGAVSIVDSSYELLRHLEMQDEEPLPAAPTGLGLLDKIIGGYFCANLAIAGGRPGMGKSILGELAARAAASAGFAVDYFDLENQASTLTARLLCDIDYDRAAREGRPPIHYSRIHLRRLSRDERGWLAEALTQLHDMDLQIHDRDELTMSQVAALCRAKAARTSKRMLVIIDHMHLIEPSNRYAGRKVDEVAEVTKGAKRLAKRLNASVLLLAQLNRDLERREDKRPNMADFRESGSIEQDADVMIGINRPHYHLSRQRLPIDASDNDRAHHDVLLQQSQNVMEIGVLKNRHGETGEVTVFVDVASSALRDAQPTAQTDMDFERMQARAYGEPMF